MQDKFDELLKRFNLLVKESPKADKISEKLKSIKEEAIISKELTLAPLAKWIIKLK